MPYATQSDMISEYGEREVIALTDRDNTGLLDAVLLADRLEKASGEIDTYLTARYVVPLSVVSPLITTYCCDIARYRLSGADVAEVDTVRTRYKDAIRFLERVQDGKIDLGADVAVSTDAVTQDLAFITGSPRVFSRGNR